MYNFIVVQSLWSCSNLKQMVVLGGLEGLNHPELVKLLCVNWKCKVEFYCGKFNPLKLMENRNEKWMSTFSFCTCMLHAHTNVCSMGYKWLPRESPLHAVMAKTKKRCQCSLTDSTQSNANLNWIFVPFCFSLEEGGTDQTNTTISVGCRYPELKWCKEVPQLLLGH